MIELKNIDQLHPEIQSRISSYCQDMISLHGERLISVVIYGSATGASYIPKKSNTNLLFIFNDLTFSILRNSLNLIKSGRKKRLPAPLFLTKEHIISSRDVFPIEFLEIKENNICLYGQDLFHSLAIESTNLRLQCEQEIKGKLIRLRQSYLEMGLVKKEVGALLAQSITSLLPTFRSLIRLKGKVPPQGRDSIIREIATDFQISHEALIRVLNIKEGNIKPTPKDLEQILESYLNTLQQLARQIDQLKIDQLLV